MRYLSGLLYALAIVKGSGHVPLEWGTGVCVFIGTVAFAFAIEGMIEHRFRKAGII